MGNRGEDRMTDWDAGFDQGYDMGALRGEERVREELTKRIEDIDLLREQFRPGVPYSVRYNGTAGSGTQLLDRDGDRVATFDSEADAQAIADILNVATAKDAAVEQVLQQHRAEKLKVS
jgi:hypothetical protein